MESEIRTSVGAEMKNTRERGRKEKMWKLGGEKTRQRDQSGGSEPGVRDRGEEVSQGQ